MRRRAKPTGWPGSVASRDRPMEQWSAHIIHPDNGLCVIVRMADGAVTGRSGAPGPGRLTGIPAERGEPGAGPAGRGARVRPLLSGPRDAPVPPPRPGACDAPPDPLGSRGVRRTRPPPPSCRPSGGHAAVGAGPHACCTPERRAAARSVPPPVMERPSRKASRVAPGTGDRLERGSAPSSPGVRERSAIAMSGGREVGAGARSGTRSA